jgi:glycosyltransferase involved in cell wall biosynthesis
MAADSPWRPLRLTLVTETFPPEVNGVARTLGRWADEFRARGHQLQIIRPRQPAEAPAPELVHGFPVPMYPQLRFGVASPLRLSGLLEKARPDVVHLATEGPLGWAALMAAHCQGLPVASSFHTNFDHYAAHYGLGPLQGLLFAFLRWFHNATAVTLAPSQATRRRLLADGVERVEIWSRGVDGRAFHPGHRDPALRRSLGLGDDDVLLTYVGRLASEKNLTALLSAFAQLRREAPGLAGRVKLALVGAGPLAAALQLAQHPNVVLAGEQHGQALSRWYASGDVFAFPSCSETFGNVVLEAQASGLPVVGFDTQGVNERVAHGADGFLAPMGGSLAEPLRRLCADVALRRRFGRAARARAEAQDWKPIFDKLEQCYLRLAARHEEKLAAATATPSRPARPMLGAARATAAVAR